MATRKVLNISPFIWSIGKSGGMPSIYNVQREFSKSGYEVFFILPASSYEEFNNKVSDDYFFINYFYYPGFINRAIKKVMSKISNGILKKILNILDNVMLFTFYYTFGLIQSVVLTSRIKPDVVYGHTFFCIPMSFFIGSIFSIPNISRYYGVGHYELVLSEHFSLINYFDPEIIAFLIPASLYIITNDGTKGDKVAQKLGVDSSKIVYIMNGVEKEHLSKNTYLQHKISNDPILFTASRLEAWKHVERIIIALSHDILKNERFFCYIAGDGSMRDGLINLSKQLHIDDKIIFLGALNHSQVIQYLNASSIYVSLYDLSNISNSVLEAMVAGKCVVALDVGDTKNLIQNNKNGILVNRDELNRLPFIIKKLLEDESLRDEIGKSARLFAEKNLFSWEERGKVEVRLINKLLHS